MPCENRPRQQRWIPEAGRARRARGGFTLVELLIVIAIIMLLVCLLFPAIHRVQDDARTVQCLSNVRQITAACMLMQQGRLKALVLYRDFGGGRPALSAFPSEEEVFRQHFQLVTPRNAAQVAPGTAPP